MNIDLCKLKEFTSKKKHNNNLFHIIGNKYRQEVAKSFFVLSV